MRRRKPAFVKAKSLPLDREDLAWLDICSNLRASGMPLTGIRRYAELVRQGPGNEQERLDLLREHRERVTAQILSLPMYPQLEPAQQRRIVEAILEWCSLRRPADARLTGLIAAPAQA